MPGGHTRIVHNLRERRAPRLLNTLEEVLRRSNVARVVENSVEIYHVGIE
jgi:hypothetical protein